MKRKSYLLLLFVFLLLSACSNPVASKNTMIIKPSQFSAETQEVLSIFDDEVFFFDYSIDETIKSFSINLWAYQNGEWVENGATYGEEEFLRNRIAICTSNNNFDLFTIDETGYTKFTAPVSETYFSDCKSIAYMPLTKSTPIELNKEILLWLKIGTDKDNLNMSMGSDFRKSVSTAGVAVTVTFSDKEAE